jgi:hypothetical protein
LDQYIKDGCEGSISGETDLGKTDVSQSEIYMLHWSCQLELYVTLFIHKCDAWAWFLPQLNSWTHAKMGQMCQYGQGLCWKIMICQLNKLATYKVVMICSTCGTLLVEHPLYFRGGSTLGKYHIL